MGKVLQFRSRDKEKNLSTLEELSRDTQAFLRIPYCGVIALPVKVLTDMKRMKVLLRALTNYVKAVEK